MTGQYRCATALGGYFLHRGGAVNARCCRAIAPATLLRHTDVPTGMSAHSVCRSTDALGEVPAAARVARAISRYECAYGAVGSLTPENTSSTRQCRTARMLTTPLA